MRTDIMLIARTCIKDKSTELNKSKETTATHKGNYEYVFVMEIYVLKVNVYFTVHIFRLTAVRFFQVRTMSLTT